MSNQYFTIQENYQEKFYRLPKVFFTNPKYTKLKNDSKIAYSILQDRLELSIKNKWVDQSGRIFFIYTDKKLAEILNISKNHVTTVKKELIEAELLIQKRQGLNKPNISYLLKPNITQDDIYIIESEETDLEVSSVKESHTVGIQNHTQWESRITHSGNLESHAVGTNDTDFSDTDFSDTELSNTTTTNENDLNQTDYKEKNISGGGEISKESLFNTVQQELNVLLTPKYKQNLLKLVKNFSSEVIAYAIEYAANYGNNPKQYLLKILENWKQAQIKTLDQAQSYTHIKTKKAQNVNVSREITPQWLENRESLETYELQSPEEEEMLKRDREALLERLNNK